MNLWIPLAIAVLGFGTFGFLKGGDVFRHSRTVLDPVPLPSGVDGFPIHGRGTPPGNADRWAVAGEMCPCGSAALVVYEMPGGTVGSCGRHR